MNIKRATSLKLIMPSTRDVSGCTTMTRRTAGIESRSSTRRSWSCLVQTYSRVRLLAARDCPSARAAHVKLLMTSFATRPLLSVPH
jgi:hypothetical protein